MNHYNIIIDDTVLVASRLGETWHVKVSSGSQDIEDSGTFTAEQFGCLLFCLNVRISDNSLIPWATFLNVRRKAKEAMVDWTIELI